MTIKFYLFLSEFKLIKNTVNVWVLKFSNVGIEKIRSAMLIQ